MSNGKHNRLLKILVFIIFISVITYKVDAKEVKSLRIGGNNRYETSINISKIGWKDSSDSAILVTGDDFPDALCSAPLAKKLKAPILLTEKNSLSSLTESELKRLKIKNIYIVGGTGVISDKVEKGLMRLGIKTERIAGVNRYETSAKIAKKIGQANKAFIVTGEDFPDALSVASIASFEDSPILLTTKKEWPDSIKSYIKQEQIKKAYIIGGTGIIDNYAVKEFSDSQRVFGSDRYETNSKVINTFYGYLNFKNIYIATGEDFPDALSGAALAQNSFSPIVLTTNNGNATEREILNSTKFLANNIILLGGEAVVSNGALETDSNIKVKNAKKYLNISTYDKSNEAVHPKVLYFSNGFSGWKYWMAYTPYPKGDDLFENPSIACSNDGISWTTPQGLSNPLIKPPTVRGEHYSDTHIVYNENTKELELWYRFTHFDVQDKIYRRTTRDGIQWSQPELMFMYDEDKTCYSPAILYENNEYKLWYVNEKYQLVFKRSSDGKNWTGDTLVNMQLKDSYLPWHLDVVHTDKGYEMLLTIFRDGERASNNMRLAWGVSPDGINYNNMTTIIAPSIRDSAWDNKQIYRSTFVKVDDVYKVYYSAMNNNHEWHIGLSQGYSLDELYGYSLE